MTMSESEHSETTAELEAYREVVTRLLKDKKRLDWLEQHGHEVIDDFARWLTTNEAREQGFTWRKAIDQAMEADNEGS